MNAHKHADLIGTEFQTEFGPARVTGTAPWNEQYVIIEYLDGTHTRSVRTANLVRAKLALERERHAS